LYLDTTAGGAHDCMSPRWLLHPRLVQGGAQNQQQQQQQTLYKSNNLPSHLLATSSCGSQKHGNDTLKLQEKISKNNRRDAGPEQGASSSLGNKLGHISNHRIPSPVSKSLSLEIGIPICPRQNSCQGVRGRKEALQFVTDNKMRW